MKIVLADIWWDETKLLETLRTTELYNDKQETEILPILISYWFLQWPKKNRINNPSLISIRNAKQLGIFKGELFVDSGVFTARKKGKRIDNNELISFYHENSDIVDYIFSNDEGTKEEQLANAKELHDAGLPVIPIYHPGIMPWDYIDRFKEYSDFIALSAFTMIDNWKTYSVMNDMFDYVHKTNQWPLKIHALGVERLEVLSRYPFYSADSSSFAQTYVYGKISVMNRKKLKIQAISVDEYNKSLKADINNLKCMGFGADSRTERVYVNMRPRLDFQKMLTDIWTKKGINWE